MTPLPGAPMHAVALAQAQSSTFDQPGNECIPQPVFDWLYRQDYVRSYEDPTGTGERYPRLTERGERLLVVLLRRYAAGKE